MASDDEHELLRDAAQFIATLAYSSNVKLLKSDDAPSIPTGCAEVNISDTCSVSIALS